MVGLQPVGNEQLPLYFNPSLVNSCQQVGTKALLLKKREVDFALCIDTSKRDRGGWAGDRSISLDLRDGFVSESPLHEYHLSQDAKTVGTRSQGRDDHQC